jgi:N-formylglutamate amidohydrolase
MGCQAKQARAPEEPRMDRATRRTLATYVNYAIVVTRELERAEAAHDARGIAIWSVESERLRRLTAELLADD